MSDSSPNLHATRRKLSEKRADTVRRLTEAAREMIVEVGYSTVTVQMVANKAGVTRATAYIYFSSKNHLISELYWREFAAQERDYRTSQVPRKRVAAVLRQAALTMADEPAVARAACQAILSDDPDVEEIRSRIAAELHRRLSAALGDNADANTVNLLDLVYTGAIMRAGSGHMQYEDVARMLESAAAQLV